MALKDKQIKKNRSFFQSLQHALQGLVTIFKDERNMKIHCLLAVIVLGLALYFQVQVSEWLWLLASIFFVVSSEIWNTVIENIVDLTVHDQFHPLAKKAKDMAAGAVLTAAVFSLFVAALIFIPRFL